MTGHSATLLPLPDAPPSDRGPGRPGPAPGSARSRLRDFLASHATALAVLIGTVLTAVRSLPLGHWLVDDAAITFAYARSVDEGFGPVQQPGAEAVEGYSNPSWLALLVLGRRLGLFDSGTTVAGVADLVWYPKLLALLCVAGLLGAVAVAARAVFPSRAGTVPVAAPAVTLLAGLAVAGNFSLVVWLFSGLENPLYALAVTALAALLVRAAVRDTLTSGRAAVRTAVLAGLLALLAALTRPDGAVYAAAHPLTVLLLTRGVFVRGGWVRGLSARSPFAPGPGWPRAVRAAAGSLGAFALPYGAFLLWRRATFGRWVPNTAVAKSQELPSLADFARPGELLTYAGWLLVLVLAGCTALVLSRPGPPRRAVAAALVPLGLALTVYGALAPDWMTMHRFATPVWTVGSLAAALALVALWSAAPPRGRAVLVLLTAVAVALSVAGRERPDARFEARPTVPMCFVAERYGQTFNAYADQLGVDDATLALPDLGGTLLSTRLTVLDLAGLTDRPLADAFGARDTARVRDHVLRQVRPEFVHVHGAWAHRTGLTPPVLSAHGYVPLTLRGTNGDWVRYDAVRDPQTIGTVRGWAERSANRLHRRFQEGGTGCGGTLRPGQVL